MSRRALTACAAAAACAVPVALPAAASAAERFKGKTSQGRSVSLRVGDDGLVQRLLISWRTTDCRGDGTFLKDVTQFTRFDESSPERIESDGTYPTRDGKVRIRISVDLDGRRVGEGDDAAWRGTFSAKGVVRRNGRVVDRCTLRTRRWRAGLVG